MTIIQPTGLYLAVVLSLATLLLVPDAYGEGEKVELEVDGVVQKLQSVVLLSFRRSNEEFGTASGFVIRRPSDDRPIIITAAHALRGGPVIQAQFIGGGTSPCAEIDTNVDLDLMALDAVNGIPVPPLDISYDHPDLRKPSERVWLLSWRNSRIPPVPDDGIYKGWQYASDFDRPSPLHKDTLLLLHNAPSVSGKSGGPLLDRFGNVIGVHNSVELTPDGESGGDKFAVSAVHITRLRTQAAQKATALRTSRAINALDLDRPPDIDCKKGIAALKVSLQSTPLTQSTIPQSSHPLTITTSLGPIDCSFQPNGDASRDAETVIRTHLKQADNFRTEFGVERLQQVLDATPLERITNSVFGFEFLVPRGYTLTPQETTAPEGIQLTATAPSGTPPFNTFSVRAFLLPERSLVGAQMAVQAQVDAGLFEGLGSDKDNPTAQARLCRVAFANHVAGVWNVAFPIELLRLRLRHPTDNSIMAIVTDGDVFRVQDLNEPPPTLYFRDNFVSESRDLCYAVRGCVLGDIVVASHYAFRKQDLDAFRANRDKPGLFQEKMLMQLSISYYRNLMAGVPPRDP